MSFSISSPDLDNLARRMDSADPVAAYHRAAADVGLEFATDLAQAFRAGGAGDGIIDALGTYIHGDGTAYYGIPGSSPHVGDARDIEYGTPTTGPSAPIRNTAASRSYDIGQKLSDALDRELGAELA